MAKIRKNTRREFIKKSVVAAGALGAASLLGCKKEGATGSQTAAPTNGKKHRWKMVTTWPKNFPGLGTGANYLAQKIQEMSGGRIEVKVYGAGELVPALGIFDAVSRGTAELGHGVPYYWKGKHEVTQFFGAVPFGLNAQEMNAWITYGGGQELWDETYRPFGLKPFAVGNTGVQMGGWYNRKINSVEDYKGLKVRMPGLGGEVLRRLGATVVTLPGGEIFQALQSGTIDGSEWVGPYNDLAFGFYQAAKYYYWPGWHEPGTNIECFVNQKAYDALSSDLKEIVKGAAEAAGLNMLAEFSARNNAALETLVKKHRVKQVKFPEAVIKKTGEVAQEVVAEIGAKDSLSMKVYASFDKFRRESMRWGKISEQAYTVARAKGLGFSQ